MYPSDYKIKQIRNKPRLTSNCTVCEDSLINNRATFEHSERSRTDPVKTNDVCYSNNQKIRLKSRENTNHNSNNIPKRLNKNKENASSSLITTNCHVNDNNICVKYITTTLPNDKFSINTKGHSLNSKLASFCNLFVPQKYKHVVSKQNQVSKFDGCRPMMISLECKCSLRKFHIEELLSNTVFDDNTLLPRCNCEREDCNQDDILKKNSQGENLCSNGCKESKNSSSTDQNKKSIFLLLLSR